MSAVPLRRLSAALGLLLVAAWPGAARADAYYVYVAAESSDQVYLARFDGTSAEVVKVIEVGTLPTEVEGPHGLTVSPDGAHWYLSLAHGKPWGMLHRFETGSDRRVGEVELGLFPATLQISPATGLLYCVNFDLHGDMTPSSVSIVDPEEMVEVARTTTGPMPHGSRLSPDGRRHYSCAMMSGELFEIDALSFEVTRQLFLDPPSAEKKPPPRGAMKGGMKAMAQAVSKPTWVQPHPTEPRLYVALNGIHQVAVVDSESWSVVQRLDTDRGPYNLEVAPDGRTMVVTYKSAGAVGLWSLADGRERCRLPSSVMVTHGVVISPDSRYAFVSSEGVGAEAGRLDVIDLNEDRLVSSVALGLQAGGIAFWKMESQP